MNKSLLSIALAPAFLSILLSSCSKNITCSDGVISIYPVGFTRTDFDSARVVRYKQNNAFDIAVDSTAIVTLTSSDKDTSNLAIYAQSVVDGIHPAFLIPGYDYKIILPAAGKTYAITSILQNGNKTQSYSSGLFGGGDLVTCINKIVSCQVDGNPVTTPYTTQTMPVNIVK